MKMTATWFRTERGLAIGVIVGALTIGKATPYLVRAIPHVGLRPVVLTASVGAIVAGLLVTFWYRDGPYPFAPRPFSWGHVRDVVRVRAEDERDAAHGVSSSRLVRWIPPGPGSGTDARSGLRQSR